MIHDRWSHVSATRCWPLATGWPKGALKIQAQHDAGSPGIQVCVRLTDLVDAVVLDLYEAALGRSVSPRPRGDPLADRAGAAGGLWPPRHGPLFRRRSDDPARARRRGEVEPLAKRLMRDLFDAGLDVGHSVRTPDEACELAAADAAICTSLVESRLLAGNAKLLSTMMQKFQRRLRGHFKRTFAMIDHARREERQQYGETVYLLEPNVKRSRGGLRDMQLFALDRLRPLRQRPIPTACNCWASCRWTIAGRCARPSSFCFACATSCISTPANRKTCSIGPSKSASPSCSAIREPRACCRSKSSCANISATPRRSGAWPRSSWPASAPARGWPSCSTSSSATTSAGTIASGPARSRPRRRAWPSCEANLGEVLRLMDLANVYNKRIAQTTWDTVRAAVSGGELRSHPRHGALLSCRFSRSRPGWASCCTGCTIWACWKS